MVGIRFTRAELERIEQQTRRTGLSRAAYVRMAALDKLSRDEAPTAGRGPGPLPRSNQVG